MSATTVLENLVVRLTAEGGQFDRIIAAAEKRVEQAATNITRSGAKISAVLTAPLAGAAGLSVKAYSTFNDTMTKATAIMSGVNAKIRADMEATAKSVASDSAVGANELAGSYYWLASAGLDAANQMAMLPKVERFATAGAFDAVRATELLMGAQAALGLKVKDATQNAENSRRVSDTLVTGGAMAQTSVERMAEAMARAGAAMRLSNVEVETGAALIGAYAESNIQGVEAGEKVKQLMRQLAETGKTHAGAWGRVGGVYDRVTGQMKNPIEIIGKLSQYTAKLSDRQKAAFYSQLGLNAEALDSIKPLLGQVALMREMEEATKRVGSTEDVAAKQAESFASQCKKLYNNVNVAAIEIGEVFAPYVGQAAAVVEKGVRWWRSLSDETRRLALMCGIGVAAVGPLMLGLGMMLKLGGVAAGVFGTLGGAAVGLALGPLRLLGGGLGLLLAPLLAFGRGGAQMLGGLGGLAGGAARGLGGAARGVAGGAWRVAAGVPGDLAGFRNVGRDADAIGAAFQRGFAPVRANLAVVGGFMARTFREGQSLVGSMVRGWNGDLGFATNRFSAFANAAGVRLREYADVGAGCFRQLYAGGAAMLTRLWNDHRGGVAAWVSFGGAGSVAWMQIQNAASVAWTTINGWAAVARGQWAGFTAMASTCWSSVQATASAAWTAVRGYASIAWGFISGLFTVSYWRGMWGSLRGIALNVWESIRSAGARAWAGITAAFSVAGLRATWAAIKAGAASAWAAVRTGAVSAAATLRVAFAAAAPIAARAVTVSMALAFRTVQAGASFCGRAVTNMGGGLMALINSVSMIAGSLSGVGGQLGSIAAGALPFLGILPAIGGIAAVLVSWPALIAGAVAAWAMLTETGQGFVDWVWSGLEPIWTVVSNTVGGVRDAIVDGNFALAGKIAITGLKAAFFTGLAAIVEKWGGFCRGVAETFLGAADIVGKAWIKMYHGVASGLLKLAQKEGFVGNVMAKVLGTDVRKFGAKQEAAFRAANEGKLAVSTDEIAAKTARIQELKGVQGTEAEIAKLEQEIVGHQQAIENAKAALADPSKAKEYAAAGELDSMLQGALGTQQADALKQFDERMRSTTATVMEGLNNMGETAAASRKQLDDLLAGQAAAKLQKQAEAALPSVGKQLKEMFGAFDAFVSKKDEVAEEAGKAMVVKFGIEGVEAMEAGSAQAMRAMQAYIAGTDEFNETGKFAPKPPEQPKGQQVDAVGKGAAMLNEKLGGGVWGDIIGKALAASKAGQGLNNIYNTLTGRGVAEPPKVAEPELEGAALEQTIEPPSLQASGDDALRGMASRYNAEQGTTTGTERDDRVVDLLGQLVVNTAPKRESSIKLTPVKLGSGGST